MCPNEIELIRYAVGTLDEAQAARVRSHLGACSSCRDLVDAQQLVHRGLSVCEVMPPDDGSEFTRRVMAAATRERVTNAVAYSRSRTALRYAAVLIVGTSLGLAAGFLQPINARGREEPDAPVNLIDAIGLRDWAAGSCGGVSDFGEAIEGRLTEELES